MESWFIRSFDWVTTRLIGLILWLFGIATYTPWLASRVAGKVGQECCKAGDLLKPFSKNGISLWKFNFIEAVNIMKSQMKHAK